MFNLPSETTISIIKYVAEHGGIVERDELRLAFTPTLIPMACVGRHPSLRLDPETNEFLLTRHGYDVLTASGNEPTELNRNNLIDWERPRRTTPTPTQTNTNNNDTVPQTNTDGTTDLISITIERTEYLTVTCNVHKKLSDWIKTNSRHVSLGVKYGSSSIRNWDADEDTKLYDINFRELENNGSYNIVNEYGFNPLIIKLACANNNTWTVKYKGLVSTDQINRYGTDLKDKIESFYKNYIKEHKIKISLQFWEG